MGEGVISVGRRMCQWVGILVANPCIARVKHKRVL
jgi:hypothetical protein